ncbi:MAG: hypothetical protein N2560_06460 [Ignavibacteria bacterium]|nr:hypothetical protein [Ignavibacteria bacterium]
MIQEKIFRCKHNYLNCVDDYCVPCDFEKKLLLIAEDIQSLSKTLKEELEKVIHLKNTYNRYLKNYPIKYYPEETIKEIFDMDISELQEKIQFVDEITKKVNINILEEI